MGVKGKWVGVNMDAQEEKKDDDPVAQTVTYAETPTKSELHWFTKVPSAIASL